MFSRESRRDGKVVRMCSAEELLGLCIAHVDRAPTGRLQHLSASQPMDRRSLSMEAIEILSRGFA